MLSRPLYRLLPLLAAAALTGCASNDFTLEADLPGNVSLNGDAHYSWANPTCGSGTADIPTRRIGESAGHNERPRRVTFQVPVAMLDKGCELMLDRVVFSLADSPAPATGKHVQVAELAVRRQEDSGSAGMPKSGLRIFDIRCRWPIAAGGEPDNAQCHAVDAAGNWAGASPGGALRIDELRGNTVRLTIALDLAPPAVIAGQ
ncbi:hypothetical protein QO207_04460 [Pseudomonas sp. CAN2814]|uniref:hypothetical protein n=1 Tax=Pseudomonas sp. CAN1 TaxID=3046726 RepID=UPI0026490F81|nr:hypothetical protein [Pseudomonas sp. CAN1]MDN6855834.1 hypothetical protein [Pseudomonas sp. CAN1]